MENVIYENHVQLNYHIDDNAIKHTPKKGLIKIKLTAHGQHSVFTITNSESGIPHDAAISVTSEIVKSTCFTIVF